MNDRPPDIIRLRGLAVQCIIGVYPHERHTPQPLSIDVELRLDTRAHRKSGLRGTVDYAKISAELRFLLESCHFLLLETAAQALCAYLLAPPTDDAPRAQIDSVRLTLEKPAALSAATPALIIERRAEDQLYSTEQKSFGIVDVLFESRDCGIYRLRIDPGKAIATHVHRTMHEREMMLSTGLLLQGQVQPAGAVVTWSHDQAHGYKNPTTRQRTILCVDRPAFQPDDEIAVDLPTLAIEPKLYYPSGS